MSENFDVFNSQEVLKMQNRKKSANLNYIGTKVFLMYLLHVRKCLTTLDGLVYK